MVSNDGCDGQPFDLLNGTKITENQKLEKNTISDKKKLFRKHRPRKGDHGKQVAAAETSKSHR